MEQVLLHEIPTRLHKNSTIVIPAYNEREVIAGTLEEVCSYISKNQLKWSVIVSVEGDDGTDKIISSYSQKFPFISMVKSNGRSGKGAAVKRVLDLLHSEYVILMDADGSLPFETIVNNLSYLGDSDALIFSRYFNHNRIPFIRRFLSRGFNVLVRASLRISIRDTQSGYKVFMTEQFVNAMKKVGPTNAFWDVSLLYHLNKENMRIKEIECEYTHRREGKFGYYAGVLSFAISLVAFRVRHSRFHKYIPKSIIDLYYKKFRWI